MRDVNTLLQKLLDQFFPARLYLYDKGNTYEDITGGWVASGSYETATANNNGKLYLKGKAQTNGVANYQTQNQVSIPAGMTKLHISNITGYVTQIGAIGLLVDEEQVPLASIGAFDASAKINYVKDDYVIDVTEKSSVKIGIYTLSGSAQQSWISCESVYVD